MRKIIALFTTLLLAVSSSFANWVKTNDDEIPIPLEWNESELDPDAQHTFNYHGPFRIITY